MKSKCFWEGFQVGGLLLFLCCNLCKTNRDPWPQSLQQQWSAELWIWKWSLSSLCPQSGVPPTRQLALRQSSPAAWRKQEKQRDWNHVHHSRLHTGVSSPRPPRGHADGGTTNWKLKLFIVLSSRVSFAVIVFFFRVCCPLSTAVAYGRSERPALHSGVRPLRYGTGRFQESGHVGHHRSWRLHSRAELGSRSDQPVEQGLEVRKHSASSFMQASVWSFVELTHPLVAGRGTNQK